MRSSRLIVLAALAALTWAAAAHAASSPQVSARRKELGQINKELENARKEIEEHRRRERELGRDLEKIESRSGESRKRLDELRKRLGSAERRKAELKARLTGLGHASEFWRGALDEDLRRHAMALAARDEHHGSRHLWAEGFRRAAMLEKVDLVLGLQGVSRTTALAEAETRRSAQQLAQRSRLAREEHLSAQAEYQAKKAAMAETKEKVAAALQRAKDLEESAKALTRLIRALKDPHGKPSAPEKVVKWEVPPHSLLWPAQGTVARPFGRARNAELDAWVISQGILLDTAEKAGVTAVKAGRVIFCGPFRSYGQVMILDHGSNFFSIYGELGETLKAKGAEVQAGEVIARAGSAKSGGAGRVYFELRRGTEALDPSQWLRRR